MDVSLRPDLEEFVNEQVKSGNYDSASDVLNDALENLRQDAATPQALEQLRRDIAVGIEQSQRGESTEWNADEIIADGRRRSSDRCAG